MGGLGLKSDMKQQKKQQKEVFSERKRLMKFNRFFAKYRVFTAAYAVFLVLILMAAVKLLNQLQSTSLKSYLETGKMTEKEIPLLQTITEMYPLLLILVVIGLVGFIKFAYSVRVSYGSLNVGQKGTDRWTTRKEIAQQYPRIAQTDETFPGYGGFPVAKAGKEIYIDNTATNNLIIGTTRSGKGEILVLPMIDNYSRAQEQASMVITDPKLELSGRTIPMLKKRGYTCYVLNLVDMEYSMGYNPLTMIIEEYKSGNEDVAQQLCTSLAFNIFPSDAEDKNKYFTGQARNVFIAAIMADIEDNIKKDRQLNLRYRQKHDAEETARETAYYTALYGDAYITFRIKEQMDRILANEPDLCSKAILEALQEQEIEQPAVAQAILDLEEDQVDAIRALPYQESSFQRKPFYPTKENEEKIHIASIVKLCNGLYATKIKGEQTALDLYFAQREEGNYPKVLYGAVMSATEGTKGNVMSTFEEKIKPFTSNSLTKLTAKSSMDFVDMGFAEKPIAIFIGLPDYDPSNYFLTTIFINQMYFTLAKMATAMPGGKLPRRASFLLDEFGNLPPLDNMSNICTVCLGRNIMFTFVIQAFAQLTDKYKENAATIRGNCGNKAYLMTTDKDTAKEVSEELGTETVTTVNRTGKKLAVNKELTEMTEEQSLLTPTELMHFEKGEMLILRYMKREDNDDNYIKTTPIVNQGKDRMQYAYQYLLDTFPANQLLYESPHLKRLAQKYYYRFKEGNMQIAKVEIETTRHIDIKRISRSAQEHLGYLSWRQEPFPASMSLPMGQKIHMNQVFNLLNLSQEERQLYMMAGEIDQITGEIRYPEDVLLNGAIEDYAWQLTTYREKEIYEKGFALLDILLPLKQKIKAEDEIRAEEQFEAELLAQLRNS